VKKFFVVVGPVGHFGPFPDMDLLPLDVLCMVALRISNPGSFAAFCLTSQRCHRAGSKVIRDKMIEFSTVSPKYHVRETVFHYEYWGQQLPNGSAQGRWFCFVTFHRVGGGGSEAWLVEMTFERDTEARERRRVWETNAWAFGHPELGEQCASGYEAEGLGRLPNRSVDLEFDARCLTFEQESLCKIEEFGLVTSFNDDPYGYGQYLDEHVSDFACFRRESELQENRGLFME
jgi:hypothetical protein